ncbi:MAG: SagB family peptide dehydrogenase [Actinomycetota bacterium]
MDPIEFHEKTKHTTRSVRTGGHFLDWSNKPDPFKSYTDIPPVALPEPAGDTGSPAAPAIVGEPASEPRSMDSGELSRLLTLGGGVIREKVYPGGERFYFRTYACAGALYPIEIYVACGGMPELDAGLYHFHPLERSLRRIRPGDPRPYLARACGHPSAPGRALVSLILSGIPWRTTWKYGPRGYRHLYWDSGMIVANLLALAASAGHRPEVVARFADRELNSLLGFDGSTEMALGIVALDALEDEHIPPAPEPAAAIHHRVARLSRREERYPELIAVHEATSIDSAEELHRGSAGPSEGRGGNDSELCPAGIEEVIRRRGSSRAFKRASIPGEQLTGVLRNAFARPLGDWPPGLTSLSLLVHSAEGFAPGAYRLRERGPELLFEGDVREEGAHLCLEQPLGGEGAATCFLSADLRSAGEAWGPRSYRAAQLEAGIRAGKIYLGAYACGFGATGLTFFDDEVRRFFDTRGEPMLAVALGRPDGTRRLL